MGRKRGKFAINTEIFIARPGGHASIAKVKDSIVGRRSFWFTSVLVASISLIWTCEQTPAAWTIGTPIVTYFAGPQLNGSSTQQMLDGGWNLVWANTISQLNFAQERGLRVMWTGEIDDATVTQVHNNPSR